MAMLKKPKWEMVALRVAAGMSGTRAYREVYGCTQSAAASRASVLLRNVKVDERIRELCTEASSKCKEDGLLALAEKRRNLAQIWRCSLGDLVDENGQPMIEKINALPAWCISEFKVTETCHVRGKRNPTRVLRRSYKLKLTDKIWALQVDNELSGDASGSADEPAEERIARRNRVNAMLRTMPAHGGAPAAP
jgi:hypothetical protein